MIIRDGQKWACRSCITGHRSSKCVHEDRELFPVAKKGRPSSQCKACTHGRTSTPQSPAIHDAQCTCQAKRRGNTGSKSPLDTPLATASSVAPPLPDNLAALHDGSKRQRYSYDSAMYNSDGSPAFPPPGWPSSSSYGSMDSMQSHSSASSATSSPQSHSAAVMPDSSTYTFPEPQQIPWSREHGTPLPVQPPDHHQQHQIQAQAHYMRLQSLQESQSNFAQWPVSYGHGHPIPPPSSPGAAGESPSTALYRAMGLQGLPEQYQHALSNPSPLLMGQPQDQDEYHRPLWLGHDAQAQMRSPDSYHQLTYSQSYQQDAVPAHSTSFYNGMASGSDIDPNYESNRFIPSDLRGDSPGWNASTPSAAIKDSWMQQLPMPDMQRPGYPDGPVRWNTAPATMHSAAYSHADNDQQGASFPDEEQRQQQEFPEPPPLPRAAASMPAPATHDSSKFFQQVALPQVMNLRLPEPRKRKSVDS